MYVEIDERGGINIMGISVSAAEQLVEAICMHVNETRKQKLAPDSELIVLKKEIEKEVSS